jgi:hypothetical protein
LRIAAAAHDAHYELNKVVEAGLARAWSVIKDGGDRLFRDTEEELSRVPDSATTAQELAADVRARLSTLQLRDARPATVQDVDEARQTVEKLRLAAAEARDIVPMAEAELKEEERRVFDVGADAWTRLLETVSKSEGGEHARALFRILPTLVLERRVGVLSKLADRSIALESIPNPAATQLPPDGGARVELPPAQRPVGTKLPAVRASGLKTGLSTFSERTIDEAMPGAVKIEVPGDIFHLRAEIALVRASGERARQWFGAAKASRPGPLQDAALAIGLLEKGLSALEGGNARPSMALLRDSIRCASSAWDLVAEDGERASIALVVAKAWARFIQTTDRRRGIDFHFWLDEPRQMFAWLRQNDLLSLAVREWADLPEDAAARQFLGVLQFFVEDDAELFRACATEIIQPSRLLRQSDRVTTRVKWLLKEAKPSKACLTALDQLAGILADSDSKLTSLASHQVRSLVEQISAELGQIPPGRVSVSPVGQLLEDLREVVTSIAGEATRVEEPKLTFQPLVSSIYPAEKCEQVVMPVLVTNRSSVPASDVQVQLKPDGALAPELQPRFTDGLVTVGDIDPEGWREVRFMMDTRPDLASEHFSAMAIGFEVQVREKTSGGSFTVAVRPEIRTGYDNPYFAGKAVKGGKFYGRDDEMAQLVSAVVGKTEVRPALVYGVRRIGKTSILFKAMEDPEVLRRYYPVYWSQEDRPSDETTVSFFEALCKTICGHLPQRFSSRIEFHRDQIRSDPYLAFERFVESLGRAQIDRRVLLLFDEVDNLLSLADGARARQEREGRPLGPDEVLQPEVFGALRKALMQSQALNIVFAGLPAILKLGYQHRLFGLLELVEVGPFHEKDAEKVLSVGKRGFEISSVAKHRLFEASGLQPYLLQLMCKYLFTRMVHSGRDVVAPSDVDEVIAERILPNETYFTDLVSLLGEERRVVFGLARALRGQPSTRRFVSIREVVETLGRLGYEYSDDQVRSALDAVCSTTPTEQPKTERPLVARAQNNPNRFRLIIGVLGDYLIRHQG